MDSVASNKLIVFLVEDNADLREEIVFALRALGFDVRGFADAAALYRALAVGTCDIVVIDVGLPGEDGFAVAEHLRGNGGMGLVFLTARASLEDRVRGLEGGADAYLVKPVDMRELAATLGALGRRIRTIGMAAPSAVKKAARERSTWRLMQGGWVLRDPRGAELALTEHEHRFLEIVVAAAGTVVPREKLIAAFAADDDYDPHRLDSIISRLRKRVEEAGLAPLPLKAVRGTGYVFTA